jgi:hypothetical protein
MLLEVLKLAWVGLLMLGSVALIAMLLMPTKRIKL